MNIKDAREKYRYQKHRARGRGIDFQISFEDWCEIWQQSGRWEQRGNKRGQYCMSRYGDMGPYSIDNVFIQQHGQNVIDAQRGRIKSDEERRKISQICKGKAKPKSDETRQKMSKAGFKREAAKRLQKLASDNNKSKN